MGLLWTTEWPSDQGKGRLPWHFVIHRGEGGYPQFRAGYPQPCPMAQRCDICHSGMTSVTDPPMVIHSVACGQGVESTTHPPPYCVIALF